MKTNQFASGMHAAETIARGTERTVQVTKTVATGTKDVVCSFVQGFAFGWKHRNTERLALTNKS